MRSSFGWSTDFNRKMVSEAFWSNEIESELREQKIVYGFSGRKINCAAVKQHIETVRTSKLYDHNCSMESTSGCQFLDMMDGLWKFGHKHCAMPVKKIVDIRHINLPQVCENQPTKNSKFCLPHHGPLKNLEQAMSKEEFKSYLAQKEAAVRVVSDNLFQDEMEENAGNALTSELNCNNKNVVAPWCRKRSGRKTKESWSRGIFVYVAACGTILSYSPIYKSESLSQVLVLTLEFLYKRMQLLANHLWSKYFLCYDNMCNLCRLKALKEPLNHVLPEGYDNMFNIINKIVDGLHMSNHRREDCHVLYNPNKFSDVHPEVSRNTMAAEQTFSWLGRYRKQVNSMNKTNQHLFLHRVIIRRNWYITQCMQNGQTPVVCSLRSREERFGFT
ncbi:uncharacterized protein LOC129595962 [Paramacrobiotus metropolitanus]|uniref:uncharacterized protein LOC129595962 n=1 Tax=Paramacrobiotus metropolitanus TaxID=2943436 RepID=UPI002445EFAA|nr:uncharacterized protein LOC129595962 [Paramacrobiotus metropolitanus]